MSNLYAKYIKEREGIDCIERDHGFATYTELEDGFYILDIYVEPSKRKTALASGMADKVAEKAKLKGHKKLYGTVNPKAKGSTESLKILLSYGFKLLHSYDNVIWFYKEI